jgi:hypothetical protein
VSQATEAMPQEATMVEGTCTSLMLATMHSSRSLGF